MGAIESKAILRGTEEREDNWERFRKYMRKKKCKNKIEEGVDGEWGIDTEIRKRVKIEKKNDVSQYLNNKMGHRRFKKETGNIGKKKTKLIHEA